MVVFLAMHREASNGLKGVSCFFMANQTVVKWCHVHTVQLNSTLQGTLFLTLVSMFQLSIAIRSS